MDKKHITFAVAICMSLPLAAHASELLAREKQCFQCHQISGNSIGPSFQNIASKWKGRQNAQVLLTNVIRDGSSRSPIGPHWGNARMPNDSERPLVNDAEAKELVAWMLAQ